jgi:non-specific serine/threonine protein kinase
LGLLANGSRTALPRHQTIRGSIEWSWNLLEPAEQALLRRLSVFVGGWTLESAEEVCSGDYIEAAQVANLMTRLVEKSLVRVEPASGKENRYTLHDMICEFAAGKMDSGEAENTRTRHLKYILRFSERAGYALHGPDQLAWINRLRDELDNLRSALAWAARTDIEAGLLIIGRLFGELDSHEGLHWSSEFTARPESHKFPQARAWAMLAQANTLWSLEKFDASRLAADESLALFRQCKDRVGEFECLMTIGSILEHREGMEQKVEYQGKALELARSLGDVRRQAAALSILAWDWRDPQRAREYREEAIRLYRQVEDWRSLASELSLYGDTLMEIGEVQAALPLLEEALQLNRRLNYKVGMEFVLVARNRQALLKKDYAGARAALQEWLTLALELGNRVGYLYGCARLGQVALAEGKLAEGCQILKETCLEFQKDKNLTGLVFTLERLAHYYFLAKVPDHSVRLYGWADGVRTRIGFSAINKIVRVEIAHDLEVCKAQLGKTGFKKAYQMGHDMTMEEAVRLALE